MTGLSFGACRRLCDLRLSQMITSLQRWLPKLQFGPCYRVYSDLFAGNKNCKMENFLRGRLHLTIGKWSALWRGCALSLFQINDATKQKGGNTRHGIISS